MTAEHPLKRTWTDTQRRRVARVVRSLATAMLCLSAAMSAGVAVNANGSAESARLDATRAERAAKQVRAVQRTENLARCAQRKESSESIRGAIAVAVQTVAVYAELDEDEQHRLLTVVRTEVLKAYPPPDC